MAIRLSYIVPVYNVEAFLQQCLGSIYSQSIREEEYEVICLNDCSQDNSYKIIEAYQSKHANMCVVTFPKNKGLSAARNEGVRMAKGKYIWFIDSDDFISNNVTERLLREAEQKVVDVLLFNYCDFIDDKGVVYKPETFINSIVMNGIDFMEYNFGDAFVFYLGYVWRMLLRREYIIETKLSFPEGQYWEDTVYFPKAILNANRVSSVDVLGYYYRKNPASISGGGAKSWSLRKIFDYCFKAGLGLYHFADELELQNVHYASVLREYAVAHYIKAFPVKLWQRIRDKIPFTAQ